MFFKELSAQKIPASQLVRVLSTAQAASLSASIRQAQGLGMKLDRVLQHHPTPGPPLEPVLVSGRG